MTLVFRFLNVGHGSSVVVERVEPEGSSFGLIDSNASAGQIPRALSVLESLGAEELSFVCMTHPHKDHYSGLFDVLRRYDGKVGVFYSNPMGELLVNKDRLKKLGEHLVKLARRTDGSHERRAALEFMQILKWASDGPVEWIELGGEYSELAPPGFAGISVHSLLPPRRNIADYVRRIETGDPLMFGSIDDNELSVALHFGLAGNSVILGGDGTTGNWSIRRKFVERGGNAARANVVNLPHHGSGIDNPPEVTNQLFSSEGQRFAVTSANGHSHPSIEVIERLSKQGIQPFCTNLHQMCGATVSKLNADPDVDPELVRVIREVALEGKVIQPCQGDICVTLYEDGTLEVLPEYANFCGYRALKVAAA